MPPSIGNGLTLQSILVTVLVIVTVAFDVGCFSVLCAVPVADIMVVVIYFEK